MKNYLIIIFNILNFINLICFVNSYADFVLLFECLLLFILLIVLLSQCKKDYISIKVILLVLFCIIMQVIVLTIFVSANIINISSGLFGLGAGPLGTLYYFFLQIIFLSLLVFINIIKYFIKKSKK